MVEPTEMSSLRERYGSTGFEPTELQPTWWQQFHVWLAEALAAKVIEPNAMVLGTATATGVPSTRTVLAKQVDAAGVVFYTNYTSAKSTDLRGNPFASATFPWLAQHRQVTVRGAVREVSRAETEAYWRTRPRESQIGAWASPQSSVVPDRAFLDNATERAEADFAGVQSLPAPQHWGGWCIEPTSVEFWQGRVGRLHDRLRYRLDDGAWLVERIAP